MYQTPPPRLAPARQGVTIAPRGGWRSTLGQAALKASEPSRLQVWYVGAMQRSLPPSPSLAEQPTPLKDRLPSPYIDGLELYGDGFSLPLPRRRELFDKGPLQPPDPLDDVLEPETERLLTHVSLRNAMRHKFRRWRTSRDTAKALQYRATLAMRELGRYTMVRRWLRWTSQTIRQRAGAIAATARPQLAQSAAFCAWARRAAAQSIIEAIAKSIRQTARLDDLREASAVWKLNAWRDRRTAIRRQQVVAACRVAGRELRNGWQCLVAHWRRWRGRLDQWRRLCGLRSMINRRLLRGMNGLRAARWLALRLAAQHATVPAYLEVRRIEQLCAAVSKMRVALAAETQACRRTLALIGALALMSMHRAMCRAMRRWCSVGAARRARRALSRTARTHVLSYPCIRALGRWRESIDGQLRVWAAAGIAMRRCRAVVLAASLESWVTAARRRRHAAVRRSVRRSREQRRGRHMLRRSLDAFMSYARRVNLLGAITQRQRSHLYQCGLSAWTAQHRRQLREVVLYRRSQGALQSRLLGLGWGQMRLNYTQEARRRAAVFESHLALVMRRERQGLSSWYHFAEHVRRDRRLCRGMTCKQKRAALAAWTHRVGALSRQHAATLQVIGALIHRHAQRSWGAWRSVVGERKLLETLARRALTALSRRAERAGFNGWRLAMYEQRRLRALHRRSVSVMVHRKAATAWHSWASFAAERRRKSGLARRGITLLYQKVLRQGLNSWAAVCIARRIRLDATHTAGRHLLHRKLSGGWLGWRATAMALRASRTSMRLSLGRMMHHRLSRGCVTWRAYAVERSTLLRTLRCGLALFVYQREAGGFRGWSAALHRHTDPETRALQHWCSSTYSRSWHTWQAICAAWGRQEAAMARSALRMLNLRMGRAFDAFHEIVEIHKMAMRRLRTGKRGVLLGRIARGLGGWKVAHAELARHRACLTRTASAITGALVHRARQAWQAWQVMLEKHLHKCALADRAASVSLYHGMGCGVVTWHALTRERLWHAQQVLHGLRRMHRRRCEQAWRNWFSHAREMHRRGRTHNQMFCACIFRLTRQGLNSWIALVASEHRHAQLTMKTWRALRHQHEIRAWSSWTRRCDRFRERQRLVRRAWTHFLKRRERRGWVAWHTMVQDRRSAARIAQRSSVGRGDHRVALRALEQWAVHARALGGARRSVDVIRCLAADRAAMRLWKSWCLAYRKARRLRSSFFRRSCVHGALAPRFSQWALEARRNQSRGLHVLAVVGATRDSCTVGTQTATVPSIRDGSTFVSRSRRHGSSPEWATEVESWAVDRQVVQLKASSRPIQPSISQRTRVMTPGERRHELRASARSSKPASPLDAYQAAETLRTPAALDESVRAPCWAPGWAPRSPKDVQYAHTETMSAQSADRHPFSSWRASDSGDGWRRRRPPSTHGIDLDGTLQREELSPEDSFW